MTPTQARERYRAAFETNPEVAVFTRGDTSATVLVRSLGAVSDAADLLTETVEQPQIKLLALAEDFDDAGYPVPLRRGDECTWRSRSRRIEKVLDGRTIGPTFIAYEVTVIG